MAVKISNPFEGSFENLTTKVVKPVVKTVISDVKENLGIGEKEKGLVEEAGLKEVPEEEKKNIQVQTAQNLDKINAEIERIRREKKKKEQESRRVEEQEKMVKKREEQKKKEDPVWLKAIRGRQGSGENKVNAGG